MLPGVTGQQFRYSNLHYRQCRKQTTIKLTVNLRVFIMVFISAFSDSIWCGALDTTQLGVVLPAPPDSYTLISLAKT